MVQKFVNGQKVKIIRVLDQRMTPRYPDIEACVTKTGTVIDGYWLYNKMPMIIRDQYIYTVMIDNENKEIAVSEDALEPLIV